jgi:Abnormal spindle-like microcephaly-assoc'd, ASPM-SPD-2-Hydin
MKGMPMWPNTSPTRGLGLVAVLVAGALLFGGTAGSPAAAATQNAIQIENAQPGTPSWNDFAAIATQDAINGYGSKISVNHGDSIDLYVTTTAATFTIDIFRTGWYGGVGARLVAPLGSFPGVHQAIPPPDAVTGMVAATNWTKTTTLAIPSDWVTGVYLAKLTASNGNKSFILFVVRNDGGTEPIMFQTSVTTAQAYNAWGGTSLYTNVGNKAVYPYAAATKVSFDRPFDPQDGDGAGQYFAFEYPFVRWAESQGYDLTYVTNVDTHTNVNPLTNHRVFLSVGHDEYWSKGMRDNLSNAIANGVNAAFFSANSMYWQIRLEANGAGAPNRVEVGYKDSSQFNTPPGPDPMYGVNNSIVTSRWRDAPVNLPENALIGVMYQDQVQRNYDYVVQNASNWIYAGTGFAEGTHVPGIVGYEYDKIWSNGFSPPGLTILSNSPVVGCCEGSGNSFSNSTLYTAPSGAQVFASGTIQWSWGLDGYTANFVNAGIQKTTANILGTLGAGTTTAPAVTITPTSLIFGSQLVGTTSASQPSTLRNSGTAPLTIASITVAGANPSDFGQTNDCPGSLAVDATCTITVTFTPSATGSRAASVQISDNAANSPQALTLSGTGGTPAPAVTLTPTSLAFGSQLVGTTSASQTSTLKNTGTAALTITGIGLTGANTADFGQTNDCPASLVVNATCTITVTFSPTAAGSRAASVSVSDNATGTPHSVALSGNGTTAGGAPIAFDKSLGTKTDNAAGTTMTLTTNAAALAGSRVFAFVVWNNATQTLTSVSGGTLTWTVDVQSKDGNNDHVAIASADAPSGLASGTVLTANFSGSVTHGLIAGASFTGVAASSPVDATGNRNQGGVAAWSATLTTTVPGDLVLAYSVIDANTTSTATTPNVEMHDFGDVNYYGWSTSTYRLAASAGATTVNGTWASAAGAIGTVTVAAAYKPAGGGSPAPAVTLSPTSLVFGAQAVGTTSASQSVTLTNSGTAPLTITGITVAGTNAADFARTTTCPLGPSTLAAGANCSIGATFAPTAAGARAASIQVADNATGSPQSVALSGTGTAPAVTLTPTSLTFGSQLVGTTSASQSSILRNSGTAPLTIASIALSGANAADFGQTNDCPGSLAVNATCTLTVTFSPSASGSRAASVQITDNAANSPQALTLSGTGGTPAPAVTLTPTGLAFGAQLIGTTSASQTSTLKNTGTAPLTITGIALTGTNPGDFGQTNDCPGSLAVNATCTITVTFSPTAGGARAATVNIADDAAGSPHGLTLSGTGTTPAPAVTLTPTSLAFGAVRVGTTSASQSSTLTNTGTAPLNISGIAVTGANAADFGQTNDCPGSLAVNATCTITVTFSPTTTGARTASAQITDDAAGSPHSVALSGTGTAPAVTLSPAAVNFGSQRVGTTSAAQTVTLTNSGTAPLSIGSVGLTGTNAGDFAQTTTCPLSPATLAAGANCAISVSFSPAAAGPRAASVQIADDASGSPHSVALSGTGSTTTISFDKSLGTKTENANGATMTLTTSGAAVAGARVFVFVSWTHSTRTLTSVTGGGLTWTVDRQQKATGNNARVAIASAAAPTGLASGVVLTATFSGPVTHGLIAAASFTGVATTAPVDATGSATGTGTAWSGSVTTTNANDLVLGFSTIDANATSAPTAPNTEIHDFGNTSYYGWATSVYRIETTTGTKTVNGTWSSSSGSTGSVTIVVAYKSG